MTPGRDRGHAQAGVAAVEFALTAPLLLIILAGVSDFPLALWDRIAMAAAVEGGANYAFAMEQNASGNNGSVSPADVRNAVLASSSLANLTVTVSAPSTHCVQSGQGNTPPVTTLTAGTPGTPCADTTMPGTYMTISASYSYAPLMPFFAMLASTTLQENAIVRLQ